MKDDHEKMGENQPEDPPAGPPQADSPEPQPSAIEQPQPLPPSGAPGKPFPLRAGEQFYAGMQAYLASRRRPLFILFLAGSLFVLLITLPPSTLLAMFRGLLAERWLVGLILAFGLIMLSLVWSAGQSLDTVVFQLFNTRWNRPVWFDRFMWGFTQIGNSLLAWGLAGIFYLLGYRRLGVEIILGTLTLWLVVEVLKAFTERARPYLTVVGVRVIGWREPGCSFPSGHTSQTFFLVTTLVRYFSIEPPVALLFYGVAVLVGITRMYVGAHYPRDVLGGAALGTVWGILLSLLDGYLVGRQL